MKVAIIGAGTFGIGSYLTTKLEDQVTFVDQRIDRISDIKEVEAMEITNPYRWLDESPDFIDRSVANSYRKRPFNNRKKATKRKRKGKKTHRL